MAQVRQVAINLVSIGIRVASVGVDPFEGGVIAWLAVEPGAIGLLDATETQALRIEEVGRVPRVRVLNWGDQPVVVRADSVIAGGKQTRVIERTAVVASGHAALLHVRCVEAHRWTSENKSNADHFAIAGMTSYRMRVKLARQRDSVLHATGHYALDQYAVWREVTVELRTTRVASSTESYLPVVSEVRGRDRARARTLGITPPASSNAAFVMPDRGAAWVEVFASNAALYAQVDELVADLVEVARTHETEPEGPASVGEALECLLAATASNVDRDAEEFGQPFVLQSARVCGSVLLHESRVAHLSAVIG